MYDKVSVIVPVYNTECYLIKCIDSLRNQTYQNLEIILVDDGSSSRCRELCDQIADSDARIHVLHKKNGGLSDARNAGMRNSTGEYLVFCDSDDWMEPDIIKTAISEIKKTEAQIVIWGYSADVVDQNEVLLSYHQCAADATIGIGDAECLSNKEIQGLLGYAWNKLYKRNILASNELLFEKDISLVEDILFNSRVLSHCKEIRFINSIGTHYVQRNTSTLSKSYYYNYCELIMRAVKAKKTIMRHFQCATEDIDKTISTYITTALKVGVLNITRDSGISEVEKRVRLRELLRDNLMNDLIHMAKGNTLKEIVFLTLLKLKATEPIIRLTKGC